ncbi:MAG: nuclear transport factor 2 family protein [Flammeovirgaceae bacterium]|nr:nuclear transport factor 2 family protein [Flammeovirgaceae bacterium]
MPVYSKFFSIFLLMISFSIVTKGQSDKDIELVLKILERQTQDWNNGDIEKFMVGYWASDKLKFIGKNGVIYGYQATLERYKKNYPNAKTMGKLKFDIISSEKLDKMVIFIVGKFHLTREIGDAEGHFSLTWKKINGDWVIIADHSS